jgi:hypothetical protein
MGKICVAALLPVHATRRNTACDRKAGAGSVASTGRAMTKKGGAGRANWGKPGDEYYDDDCSDFDCTDLSPEEAIACTSGLEWAEVDSLSDEDQSNMDELEEAMREDWLRTQESESQDNEIQDEGEAFFNSLDPKTWVDQ